MLSFKIVFITYLSIPTADAVTSHPTNGTFNVTITRLSFGEYTFTFTDELGATSTDRFIVGENVMSMVGPNFGCILITHYERLLDYIKPNYVHIMINGKIVMTGGPELITKIDQQGYDWVKEELGIDIASNEDEKTHILLGSCAHAGKN